MMDPDYDLFVAIAEARSLSGAARVVGTSTASVSKRLVRLEERLGTRLVNRTTRRMSLTPRGERFLRDLVQVKASLGEAEERVSGYANDPAGLLRITAPTSFGRVYLPPVIASFARAWPDVQLELNLDDIFVDLLQERYDLAIRIGTELEGRLVSHRLADSRRVLCAAPEYLLSHATPTRIGELAAHQLLAATGQLPWQLTGPGGQLRYKGRSIVETNSSEMVRELTRQGLGISLRSLWDVADDLAQGRLVQVLPDYEGSRNAAIYAVHAPMPRLPAALRLMIDHLRETLAQRSADA